MGTRQDSRAGAGWLSSGNACFVSNLNLLKVEILLSAFTDAISKLSTI
jgi:hypothetical protein